MATRPKIPGLVAEMAAEFAGTMILILFGVGVVAQVVAGGIGDHDSIAWAWGTLFWTDKARAKPGSASKPVAAAFA